MILAAPEILRRIREGSLSITPSLDIFQLQSHAIDLRLGFRFFVPKAWMLTERGRVAFQMDHFNSSPWNSEQYEVITLHEGQFFDILPGEHITVTAFEKISLPNDVMAVLYPRSSVNRRGLSVDLTGIIDAGYTGNLIIPVRNNTQHQVVRLYPGERFCQIVFEQISQETKPARSRWDSNEAVMTLQKEKNHVETELLREGHVHLLKQEHAIDFTDS